MDEQVDLNDEAARAGRASRRQVLAGMGLLAGAGAVGVLGVSGVSAAGAAPLAAPGGVPGPGGTSSLGGATAPTTGPITSVFPADTPGLTYRTLSIYNFQPQLSTLGLTISGQGAHTTLLSGFLIAPFSLPAGAVIKEWAARVFNNTGSSQTVNLERFDAGADGFTGGNIDAFTVASTGAMVTGTHTLTSPFTVGTSDVFDVYLTTPTNGNFAIWGARVGYVDPTPGFHPITPARVYDSRWSPAPAGVTTGPLVQPNARVVSVANARNLVSGAIVTSNLVPVGATAISYNLTAVSTTGAGFLAITPGNAGGFSASAINWNGVGTAIANGGVVTLDGSRQVKVFAAGGADFILDITGYYL